MTSEAALRQLRGDDRVVLVLTLRADIYEALMASALWEDVGGRPMRLDVAPLQPRVDTQRALRTLEECSR